MSTVHLDSPLLVSKLEVEPEAVGVLGELVSAVARAMVERGVPHAFLRGHEKLPQVRLGSDIDISVPSAHQALFEELLGQACAEHAARVWQRHRAGFLTQLQLHARTPDGKHSFLSIDVHNSEACFGVPFLEQEQLCVEGETSPSGLRVPPVTVLSVANFMGPYLSGGVVKKEFADALQHNLKEAPAALRSILRTLLGPSMSALFLQHVAEGRVLELQQMARSVRRKLLLRRVLRAPLRSLSGCLQFAYGARIRPIWRPRGLFLAFLGTDGAGKSTVLEAVEETLRPVFRSNLSQTWHLRTKVIPQLDTLLHLGRSTYTDTDMVRPHRAKPSGALLSNVRVAYYWVDYVVGHLCNVLPRRRRQSLILFDRYYHDYLVDPLRCRVRRNTWMVRFLEPWVPAPDQVIVVSASYETVRSRKQELSPEESAFQIAAYETLAVSEPGFALVHNEGTVEESVDAVLDVVFGGVSE